ncbi:MAG: ATP phosphoribosyltransferase regulatory subunit [Coriobacteriales bacterium]|jgi:ATP phosphoribosyltransferase regulatory subunit|nr:ATP phosphoribosyltransferase regulatory subunit [Coriobacteriales bacterium]
MIPVTPRGFKDILPTEARWRERIITAARQTLSLWGYDPIETPTLEVLEVLEQGGQLSSTPFRLFDVDNELLVLRPDVTLQVARMVASRLDVADLPLRLRYVQPVFREEQSLRAASRQFTQIGVESIGLSGALADAEVLLLAIDVLEVCGLKDFTLCIGTVGVLRLLLDACVSTSVVNEQWRDEMLAACHEGDAVRIEGLSRIEGLDSRLTQALRALPKINGHEDAIHRCRNLAEPLGLTDGLDQLQATWEIITKVGAAQQTRVDFSVISSYDYYTGLVFEVYAPGLGVALGSGGRYDRMMRGFGKDIPAAGFAFSLEAVMRAMILQGSDVQEETNAAVTVLEAAAAKAAGPEAIDPQAATDVFLRAARLRAQGTRAVVVDATTRPVQKES